MGILPVMAAFGRHSNPTAHRTTLAIKPNSKLQVNGCARNTIWNTRGIFFAIDSFAMAETVLTTNEPYDYAGANQHYAEHVFPVRNPVAGSRSRCVVVTCSDPRCSPEHFFKLKEQEATVIRNEGGRTADPAVIRTVVLLSSLMGSAGQAINEVLVVHHTGKADPKIFRHIKAVLTF